MQARIVLHESRSSVLSSKAPKLVISQEEIHAVYEEGEECVGALLRTLVERINKLEAEISTLKGQLGKHSRNSSKPPSKDVFTQKTRSLRRKSAKKSGGQAKHQGHTLEWSDTVDWVHEHSVSRCQGCGASLQSEPVQEVLLRQVVDIPAFTLEVSEHRADVKCCPNCGQQSEGTFPVEASNVVQYGPRLKGIMVYLMESQLLPAHRTVELLTDVLGVNLSEGTLYNTREKCFQELETITESIRESVLDAKVVHFDETGCRVNGQRWWLHVASTGQLTYYFLHPKRGRLAMNEMQVLPEFSGKAIHDGWKSYEGYGCEHFLCNAHHLRELQFILEHHEQFWAYQMSLLLVTIHRQVQQAKADGQSTFSSEQSEAFETRYLSILDQGCADNPILKPPKGSKQRGRTKQSPPRNLLNRLKTHKDSVLGFMYDFDVPFDNNQAERDLRMMKLKQKISGCFRSQEGGHSFCRIRGYISTLRKQGHNVLDALIALFSNSQKSLLLQPE